MDNLLHKKLPGTTLPTATGTDAFLATDGGGKLYHGTSGGNDQVIRKKDLLDYVYPVGKIYISVDNVSPASWFAGTTWEKITSDAYLKIVTSNTGAVGGTTSDHKIPETSMPPHSHPIRSEDNSLRLGASSGGNSGYNLNSGQSMSNYIITTNSGGGQPYYPYYYGIYVWRRTV